MRNLLLILIGGLIMLSTAAGSSSAETRKIKLVEHGRSSYVIVIPAQPSQTERFAAEEVVRYIEKISGSKLPIREGGDLPKKAVVISERSHLGNWISDKPDLEQDGYAILTSGSHIFLTGGRGRSTLYAAYDFLHRLGCEWLAPDFSHYQSAAEYVPIKDTIEIKLPQKVIEKPAFSIRKIDTGEGLSHNNENLVQMIEWMAKMRFNTLVLPYDQHGAGRAKWDNWRDKITPELQKRDMIIEVGGHGYPNFLGPGMESGKLFEMHPEWFGQDENGIRDRGDWNGKSRRVFCTSNQDAVKYLIANFIRYIKSRPEIQVFDFWPPDGAVWCECDRCKALGDSTERQILLLNQVRAETVHVRPDLRIEMIAYHRCLNPPVTVDVDKDILVDFCPDAQCFEVQMNEPGAESNAAYVAALKNWRKVFSGDINIYTYYRKYMWRSLPVTIPHYMQKDLLFYRTFPIQGIQCYGEPGDWYTYELNHYILGQLDWNPSVNVDNLIKKFCALRYGPAADEAISAFTALEDVVRRTCNIPLTSLKSPEELVDAKNRLDGVQRDLESAQSKIEDKAVKRNIERLRLSIQYAMTDLDIQHSKAAKTPAEDISKLEETQRRFVSRHTEEGLFF